MGARVTQAICKLEAAERPIPDDRKVESKIVWGHGWYNVREDGSQQEVIGGRRQRASSRRKECGRCLPQEVDGCGYPGDRQLKDTSGRIRRSGVSRRRTTKGRLRTTKGRLRETDYEGRLREYGRCLLEELDGPGSPRDGQREAVLGEDRHWRSGIRRRDIRRTSSPSGSLAPVASVASDARETKYFLS
ncbi:hypothetical protein BGX38DRAFT_1279401 [Terfezia claveryi]|nr:hypothetical protein BGX38DRAFT_1279401 [Terfezia claveryi]